MEHLKTLLGSAYHEGITVEEINTFLSTGKFVNLKDGRYVDKDKYDNLQKEHNDLVAKTKDYDELKANNEKYESEKKDNELNNRLKNLGFNEKALKYVKGDINDGSLKISDDDKQAKKDVEAYLKEHPNFATTIPDPHQARNIGKVFATTVNNENGEGKKSGKEVNASINSAIRLASGHKVDVDGEGDI